MSSRELQQDYSERRLFDRFPSRYPARVKDTRDDYGTKIFLNNASAEGISFTSRMRLYLSDHLTLEVKLPDHENPLNVKGEVVWVRSNDLNNWDIGLKFHKIRLMQMSRLHALVNPENLD